MALRLLGRRTLVALLRSKSHRALVYPPDVDVLLGEAVLRDDAVAAKALTAKCVAAGRCPSLPNLLFVLQACAQDGDRASVSALARLCSETKPEYSERYGGFRHFLAEAVWVSGNVEESLAMFGEVYAEKPYLRRTVRLAVTHLVRDTIAERSEAAMVNVVAFAERLVAEYGDYFTLTCVWEACILSEWHHDQTTSSELLERNPGLVERVTSRVPYVVGLLLRQHRPEPVYKILETLLRYDMRPHYPFVLLALLDYQLSRGDLRSCVEIVRWSSENDVPLPALQQRDFLDLLSRYDDRTDVRRASQRKIGPPPRFKF